MGKLLKASLAFALVSSTVVMMPSQDAYAETTAVSYSVSVPRPSGVPNDVLGEVEILVDNLNLRTAPNLSSSVVRTLSKGSKWRTYKEENGFYHLGGNQWIAAGAPYTKLYKYETVQTGVVTVKNEVAQIRNAPTWDGKSILRNVPNNSAWKTFGTENGFYHLGGSQWVAGSQVTFAPTGGTVTPPVTPPTNVGIGTVEAKQALNVRNNSSWSAGTVRTIAKGAKMTAYKKENGFFNIGTNEWIPEGNDFAVLVSGNDGGTTPPVTPPTNQEIGTIEILVSDLQLRTGPGTNYSVIKKMDKGSKWKVFKKQNDFYNLGGDQWISANPAYVNFVDKNGGSVTPPAGNGSLSGKKIVLDAGHGGVDGGSVGIGGLQEGVVTQAWTETAQRYLEAKGATVYMAHGKFKECLSSTATTAQELQCRVNVASTKNADIFISIHANSYINPNAYGTETFYDSTGNAYVKKSENLARAVHKYVQPAIGSFDRKVKDYDYYVLRKNTKPAILIETAFVTNASDAAKLKDSWTREKFGAAVANGVVEYFKSN